MKGPCWIKQWIADFAMLNEQFRNEDGTVDFAALGREEYLFRTALITCNFSKSSRAKDVYEIAKRAYDSLSEKGKKGGRPRKDKESTAGAPTREDGEFKSGSGDAVNLESATPAKPSLAYSGQNGLVRLSDDEYNVLLQKIGNKRKADNAIAPIPAANAEEPAVMNLAYSGEFGNVRLTQQEYSELGIRFGNKRALDRAIDSLSCQIENGEKAPKSHYAELVKWATYRDDMDEKKELEDSKPKMSNMEKSWISTMKKVGMM